MNEASPSTLTSSIKIQPMKTYSLKTKAIFALTVSAMLSISSQSSAATLTWDANGATALQTDGGGLAHRQPVVEWLGQRHMDLGR